jgi:hypothetical protein
MLLDKCISLALSYHKKLKEHTGVPADKRQSMGQLLTAWFPASDRTMYVTLQRKEPRGGP